MSLLVDIKKQIGKFYLDISFKTDEGITGLLGSSGSGKSMTLMSIAGIIKPDSGKIILNDNVLFDSETGINQKPQQRRVGYLFQNYALFPNMNVRQNILCGLHKEKNKAKRENAYEEIIELMQLKGYEERRPDQLSGGQQQRVALARILVGDPEVLMLDEPFNALDSHLRSQLQIDTQKILKRFGKTTLLVTHNRNEAYQLCSDIAVLESGKVIIQKDTKELFADPESSHAALVTGCKNVAEVTKIGEHEVDVPDWGIHLKTSRQVRDDIYAVGIRAHYFDPGTTQNRFPVKLIEEIENPFEFNIQFRYKQQSSSSQDIWWRIPKDKKTEQFPLEIGIDPENIMLLYK